MSLEETKEKLEWRKRDFEYELKNTYGIENPNDMTRIHDDEENKIAEWNLLHDIMNTSKRTKNLNSHYFPILHGCMDNRRGKAKLKNIRILLENGCSSMIVMIRPTTKIKTKTNAMMQWNTQAVNLTTNMKV